MGAITIHVSKRFWLKVSMETNVAAFLPSGQQQSIDLRLSRVSLHGGLWANV